MRPATLAGIAARRLSNQRLSSAVSETGRAVRRVELFVFGDLLSGTEEFSRHPLNYFSGVLIG
jgi:hypothetical protein